MRRERVSIERPGVPVDPVVAAFVVRLRRLYAVCGMPKYGELAEVSRRLGELYPDAVKGGGLLTLSAPTISAVLCGRRARLPKVAWVRAFVLACQRCAFEAGVAESDPGTASLPEWERHVRDGLIELLGREYPLGL